MSAVLPDNVAAPTSRNVWRCGTDQDRKQKQKTNLENFGTLGAPTGINRKRGSRLMSIATGHAPSGYRRFSLRQSASYSRILLVSFS